LVGKRFGKHPRERPRRRGDNNFAMYFREIGCDAVVSSGIRYVECRGCVTTVFVLCYLLVSVAVYNKYAEYCFTF
jgi:hypothetical protein